MKKIFLQQEKGFALLFAVLIASVVLAISLGISLITLREVKLSGLVRDGTYAVYAANSGYECALFYDEIAGTSSTFVKTSGTAGIAKPIYCGQSASVMTIGGNDGLDYTEFQYNTQAGTCAKVRITIGYTVGVDPYTGDDVPGNKISSRGYNMSCTNVNANDSRLVERQLDVEYAYKP
jgi:hypothetical protein